MVALRRFWARLSRGPSAAELLCLLLLAFTGVVIGLPIFAGGHTTYLDNPAHLAEFYDLAGSGGNGWSDLALCGLPLGGLHSPLWTSLLVAWTRCGLDPVTLYAVLLWIAFCLPAMVLYLVSRRRAGPLPSVALSFAFLVQRPALVGSAAALGGMWTFFLAAAGLIVLADLLSRASRTRAERLGLVLLAAGIGLTHLFVALTLVYLFFIHLAFSLVRGGRSRGALPGDAASLFLGGLISAPYWMPFLLARGGLSFFQWDLTAGQVLKLLLLPLDVKDLLLGRGAPSPRLFYTDALPLLALAGAGLAGIIESLRRPGHPSGHGAARPEEDDGLPRPADRLPAYGAALALLLLLVLTILIPWTHQPLLGISSWRQTYFVRLGLALAALPWLTRISGEAKGGRRLLPARLRRRWAVPAASLAVLSGLWWATPLRDETPRPSGPEMEEVRALWRWMLANHEESWGRVYLQDTFLVAPRDSRLSDSHILTLTSQRTGLRQVGAYYGVMPYRTARWVGDLLYTGPREAEARRANWLAGLRTVGVTHLVLSSPPETRFASSVPQLRPIHQAGRFTVYEIAGARPRWTEPLTPGLRVEAERYLPGRIDLRFSSDTGGGAFWIKESYHPFWRIEGSPGAVLSPLPSGLMRVDRLPAGSGLLALRFRPPRWPAGIALLGLALVALWLLPRRRGVKPLPGPDPI